jgi:hypothetical protein
MSKTRGARAKRFPYGKVYRPRDFGVERVSTLNELAMLDPIPPSEPMPAEVQRMLEPDPAVWYVESDGEPDVRVTRTVVGRGPRGAMWAVRLDGGGRALRNGRPGLGQSIVKVNKLVSATDLSRHEGSYRPRWVRTEFLPRLSPHRHSISEFDLHGPIMRPMDYTGEGFVSGWPWTCIGKVSGGFDTDFDHTITTGTGVLVGRNVLLTASHIAIWNRGPGQWWMRFVPGFDNGPRSNLGSSFVEQFRGPGPQTNPNPQDFVVCKLYEPLGDALGFLGCHWSSDDDFYYDQRWLSAGYPDFKFGGQRLISEYDIEVQDIDNDGDGREIEISLNNFLLNGGWSGGPLWGWFPGNDPRVIGICSGWEMDGWDPVRAVFAGGGPLVNYARAARHDWS